MSALTALNVQRARNTLLGGLPSQAVYNTPWHMPLGRPPTTTHAEIERVALGLFAERGFETTTVDEIAAVSGVGGRTLFRYFKSKNDIAWGDFDWLWDGCGRRSRRPRRCR